MCLPPWGALLETCAEGSLEGSGQSPLYLEVHGQVVHHPSLPTFP